MVGVTAGAIAGAAEGGSSDSAELEDERQLLRRGCTEVGDDGAPCGVRERFRHQVHAAIWGPSREGRVRHLRPTNSPSAGAIHILFHNRICSWSLCTCWGAIQAESVRHAILHARLCSPQTARVLRSPTGSSTQHRDTWLLMYPGSRREEVPYHEAGCSGVCSRGALRLRGGRSWHSGGRRQRRSAVTGSPLDQELCCLPAKMRTPLTHPQLPAHHADLVQGKNARRAAASALRTRKSAVYLHAHKHSPFVKCCRPILCNTSGVNKAGRYALAMSDRNIPGQTRLVRYL